MLSLIDDVVSKNWIGIVVLNDGGDASGGKMYEAARLLKEVIGGRAYLLLSERVDIAAAVNASGVLLSDQGFVILYIHMPFKCTSISIYQHFCYT